MENLILEKYELTRRLFMLDFVERILNGEKKDKIINEAVKYGFNSIDILVMMKKYENKKDDIK